VNRRGFISSVALAVLAPPLAAEAQQPAKTYRIGVIAMQAKEVFPLRQKYAAANHFIDRLHRLRRAEAAGRVRPGCVADRPWC
jgi:ABC-type sugar transport system substrate-binding protein